ncbi:MAG: MFS transporter [Pseudobdellovibrionaceae bacterium]
MPLWKNMFASTLGKDFWYYRIGQVVSLLGDSCSNIALAWWILDKTGSAAQMSSVLAPAMVVRIFLMPLFGPLADRYSRKMLIIIADLWRFVFTALLAGMVYFNHYNIYAVISLFILISIGSALFAAASGGIIPKLVERDQLQVAMQQTQAINSFAGIVGGVIGGIIVSTAGVFGAFLFDALSYVVATLTASRIKANTTPERIQSRKSEPVFRQWTGELLEGFQILYKIPVLFWLCIVAMLMNLALSPLGVILPVLSKEGRNMPPWFLGALESSISLGAIVGAFTFATMKNKINAPLLVILSIAMMGIGVIVLPWVPNAALPLSVLFWIGIGSTWANIPIGTQISLSVPDSHRARIGSIMGFLCSGISPLGVAGAGILISSLGLTNSLIIMGGVLVLLTPLMFFIPHYREFVNATPKEAGEFFEKHYPEALKDLSANP